MTFVERERGGEVVAVEGERRGRRWWWLWRRREEGGGGDVCGEGGRKEEVEEGVDVGRERSGSGGGQ